MEIRTLPLEHLGLVAGVFDQLEIAEIIDDRIPKLRNHNLEHSKVIKAMILNAVSADPNLTPRADPILTPYLS